MEKQNKIIFTGYSEEVFKEFLQKYIYESFENLIEDKLKTKENEIEYISIPETARLLNKTKRTIYNWIDQGIIKRYYIANSPYVKKSEILNLPQSKIEETRFRKNPKIPF